MATNSNEDINHLAMLAIPVVLSLLIGFSGGELADPLTEQRTDETESSRTVERESRDEISITEAVEAADDRRQKLKQAVLASDYEAFTVAAANTPFGEVMTEPAFAELVTRFRQYQKGYRPSPFVGKDSWLS